MTDPVAAAGAGAEITDVTEDGFLDNRLRLRQPKDGYRAAIDPVFLAAAVPGEPSQRALDIGAGVGAASLMLAWRVQGLRVTGLELDPGLVRLAGDNARLNGLDDRVDFMVGNITRPPGRLLPASFDHVLANPPYLEAGAGTPSPNPGRARANMAADSGPDIGAWLKFGITMLRDKGTMTLIHRADRLDMLLAALAGRIGDIVVFPLWPDAGAGAARRVIVQGRKGARGGLSLARGLILHDHRHGTGGQYTEMAEKILRGGGGLDL